MTREEQLDWLRRLKSDISYMDFSIDVNVSLQRKSEYRQVLSEVIKALKQEGMTRMTRLEENKMVIEKITEKLQDIKLTGTYEEIVAFQLGTITTMLADISKSFTIIADKIESEK